MIKHTHDTMQRYPFSPSHIPDQGCLSNIERVKVSDINLKCGIEIHGIDSSILLFNLHLTPPPLVKHPVIRHFCKWCNSSCDRFCLIHKLQESRSCMCKIHAGYTIRRRNVMFLFPCLVLSIGGVRGLWVYCTAYTSRGVLAVNRRIITDKITNERLGKWP